MKIIIIGAGKLGFDLTKVLSREEHDVIIIDKNADALKPIADHFDAMTVLGNGASTQVLEDVEVKTADIMLAVTENDELNVIACMIAKQYGVPMTVARVRSHDYSPSVPFIFSHANIGIDLITNPEYLAAQEIFRLIEVPMASGLDYFAEGKLSMMELKVDENLAISGKLIRDLNLDRFTIVTVIRNGTVLIPNGGTKLLPQDKIFVLGKTTGFQNLNGLIKMDKPQFKRIVIAGGGLIGEYLVKMLRSRKSPLEIKIIEIAPERCRALSQRLEGCQIICADATNIEIFEEESLGPDDIFISVTGSDNSNLVASMLASKRGVKEIICEITREEYIGLAETAGVTAAITPRLLTVSTILKLVRQSNVVSVNLLNCGEIQTIELIAEANSPVTRADLRALHMSSDVVVGAIIHQGEVVVPRGSTRIAAGDHAIIFSKCNVASEVERMFHAYDLGEKHAL